jgi:hypothetical protein
MEIPRSQRWPHGGWCCADSGPGTWTPSSPRPDPETARYQSLAGPYRPSQACQFMQELEAIHPIRAAERVRSRSNPTKLDYLTQLIREMRNVNQPRAASGGSLG